MQLMLMLVAAVTAAPFEDTQRRFHLDLPQGWQFSPQPGDVGGATFRRTADGALAQAMVRVMPLGEDVALERFVAQITAASSSEPGYRQLLAEPCTVASKAGFRRRFLSLINGDPKLAKMAEQRLLVDHQTGYVVHAESLADAFAAFEGEVQKLLGSFALGASLRHVAAAKHPHMRDLTGAWFAVKGHHRITLSAGGTMTFDDDHGTFRVEQGTLMAELSHGTQIFGLDLAAGKLTLSGGPFGEGLSFVRASAPATPVRQGKATKKAATGK